MDTSYFNQSLAFAQKIVASQYPHAIDSFRAAIFQNELDFGGGGFGSNLILRILDKNDNLLFIVKLQKGDPDLFPHFLPIYNIVRGIPLKKCSLILPSQAELVPKRNPEDDPLILLAIPAADGTALTTNLRLLGEKKRTLEDFLPMTAGCAQAMHELNTLALNIHDGSTTKRQENDDLYVNIFRSYLEEAPKDYPFTLSKFEEMFKIAFLDAHILPFYSGFTHGDCNLTNIFYSLESHTTSLVDSLSILRSISRKGEPQGIIAHDFCWVRHSLELYAFYYECSKEEIQAIDTTFVKNYSLKIPEAHQRYYSTVFWLAYYIIVRNLKKKYPALKPSLKNLTPYILNKIDNNLKL